MKILLYKGFPAILVMTAIFVLSHQSGSELNAWMPFFQRFVPWMDNFNWGHIAAYFILSLTYYWFLLPAGAGWKGKMLAVCLCLIYGVTDEFHQHFVPGRMPDLLDLANDGIGAIAAMLFVSFPPLHRRLFAWARSIKY